MEVLTINICRCCMGGESNLVSLFTTLDGFTIADVLEDCCQIEINEDNKVPTMICESCIEEMLKAFTFVRKTRENDNKLKQMFQSIVPVLAAPNQLKTTEQNNDETEYLEVKQEIKEYCDIEFLEDEIEKVEIIIEDKVYLHENYVVVAADQIIEDNTYSYNEKIETGDNTAGSEDERVEQGTDREEIIEDNYSDDDYKEIEDEVKLVKIGIKQPFCCGCLVEFSTEEEMNYHSKIEHSLRKYAGKIKKPFQCGVCFKFFKDKKAVKAHHETANTTREAFECTLCSKRFMKSDKEKFRSHISGHLHQRKKIGVFFSRYKERSKGMTDLVESCGGKWLCCGNDCNFQGKSESELMKHANEIHSSRNEKDEDGLRPAECNICYQRYSYSSLRPHQRGKYYLIKNCTSCEFCGKRLQPFEIEKHKLLHVEVNFPCDRCPMTFTTQFKLGVHKNEHLQMEKDVRLEEKTSEPFLCCGCFKGFDTKSKMLIHAEDDHSRRKWENGKFIRCSVCRKSFENDEELNDHTLQANAAKMLIECTFCQKRFLEKDKKQAKTHIYLHLKTFKKTGELKSRWLATDNSISLANMRKQFGFVCCAFHCRDVFETEKKLLAHSQVKHSSDKTKFDEKLPIECPYCFRKYQTEKQMKKHHRDRYYDKRAFKICTICGDRVRISQMQRHTNIHLNKKNVACKLCDKKFYTQKSLKSHLKTHKTERPYECECCGCAFKEITHLQYHINGVHKKVCDFSCNLCTSKFNTKGKLKAHQKVHTGEKPYKCSYCERYFADKTNMQRHEVTHTKKYPYNCSECDKGFLRRGLYEQHKSLHN